MDPKKLSAIAEEPPKAAAIARMGSIAKRIASIEKPAQWRESELVDSGLDIWVAPEEQIQERFQAAQMKARPALQPRKSFPEQWQIAGPQALKAQEAAQDPIRPRLPRNAHTDTDLTLRRVQELSQRKDAARSPIRVISESEWAETLAETERLRKLLAAVEQLRDLNEHKAPIAKKSPWQRTKGFLTKMRQKLFGSTEEEKQARLKAFLQTRRFSSTSVQESPRAL